MEEAGVAAGAAAGAGALPGPSQPTFCGRPRKSGVANIFQGVNLRQLRRLFQSAGEPDPERRARQVWGGRRAGEGAGDDDEEEEEEHLAQALVGLRVRARTRSGIRAESARGGRSFNRTNERTESGSDDETGEEDPPRGPGKDPDRYLHRVRH